MAPPKPLRTISVNFPFKDPSVVNVPNFSTSHALFDFEVVVVRPFPLIGAHGDRGPFDVAWREYSRIKKEMEGKIEDINRLLHGGGLLVVVLDAVEVLKCHTGGYTGGTVYTVTNYDFLDNHLYERVSNGSGERVYCERANPFSKTILASKVLWSAFIDKSLAYPFNDANVFATNGSRTIIGASVEAGAGHIVFLPNFRSLDEASFFEACREYRLQREGTPPPDWVPLAYLSGQAAAEGNISSLEGKIEALEREREGKLGELSTLLGYKKLLFEKGKTQLEPIVVKALNDLGFQASSGEIIPGTNFEIDGRTKAGSVPGILEIKGSKNQIGLDELGPFPTKILSDLKASKVHSKGILVGNGLCLQPPQTRLGKGIFTQHVLDAAKTNSIALINSVDLYSVVSAVLDGQIRDFDGVRETMLAASGYVDLLQFVAKSPFPAK